MECCKVNCKVYPIILSLPDLDNFKNHLLPSMRILSRERNCTFAHLSVKDAKLFLLRQASLCNLTHCKIGKIWWEACHSQARATVSNNGKCLGSCKWMLNSTLVSLPEPPLPSKLFYRHHCHCSLLLCVYIVPDCSHPAADPACVKHMSTVILALGSSMLRQYEITLCSIAL